MADKNVKVNIDAGGNADDKFKKVADSFKEVEGKAKDAGGALDALKEKMSGAMSGFASAGQAAAGAIANVAKVAAGVAVAGIGALAAAITGAISASTAWSEKLDGIGDVLGTTANESATLAVAIQGVGGNVDNITTQMAFFQKGLYGAKGALGPAGEALKELGINAKSANFKDLGVTEQLNVVATALNKMPDGLEKSTLMMKIFGKSGKDLSDVMGALADDGLQKAANKAAEFGLTVGDDAVGKSVEFGRTMNDLKMMLQGVWVTIGTQLMPVILPLIQSFAQMAREHLPQVRAALFDVVAGFTAMVPTIISVFSQVSAAVQVGINIVRAFFDFFQSDELDAFDGIGTALAEVFGGDAEGWRSSVEDAATTIKTFITGAISAFTTAVAWVQTNWPPFRDTVIEVFNGVVAWVQANWPIVQESIVQVFNAIQVVWESVLKPVFDFMLSIFQQIYNWTMENWPLISSLFSKMSGDMAGSSKAIGSAFETLKPIIEVVWTAIKTIITGAVTVILGVFKGMLQILNGDTKAGLQTIYDTFADKFNAVKTFLEGLVPKMLALGTNIMNGLYNGMVDAGEKIKGFLTGLIKDALGKFADFLDIHSPSRLTRWYGQQTAIGYALGIDDMADQATRSMMRMGQNAMLGLGGVINQAQNATGSTANIPAVNTAASRAQGYGMGGGSIGDATGAAADALGTMSAGLSTLAGGAGTIGPGVGSQSQGSDRAGMDQHDREPIQINLVMDNEKVATAVYTPKAAMSSANRSFAFGG